VQKTKHMLFNWKLNWERVPRRRKKNAS